MITREVVPGSMPSNYDENFKMSITKDFDKSGAGVNSQIVDAVEDCVKLGAHVVSLQVFPTRYFKKTNSFSFHLV